MKRLYLFALVPLAAGCVPRGAVPQPIASPEPAPRPRVAQPPQQPAPVSRPTPAQFVSAPPPVVAAWADAALSPGRWIYQGGRNGGSRALYGPAGAPSFQIACEGRALSLARTGAGGGSLTVRTTSSVRALSGTATPQGLSVQLPVDEPILDAMAFSRGRFAVEVPELAQLIVPAWPELARVVEDCRR